MIVYKSQESNWQPQSDSLGVSPLKRTQSTPTFISGLCRLVESLRQLTCFIGCFTDLCKMPTLLHSHNKWIITFIDDAPGFAALHFLQSKADTVCCFQDLVSWAEAQTGNQS